MNTAMRNFMDQRKQGKNGHAKPAKPVVKRECAPGEILTYACGHKIGARYIQGSKCACCISQQRRERRKQKPPRKPPYGETQRLPDGAAFSVIYDAANQTWLGTLTVPGFPVLEGTCGGVFRLLKNLDQKFRKLAEGAVPEASA